MPRPDCPRCGSALVVAAASATPSESVLELRSGTARVGGGSESFDHWLCRVCGHHWDPSADPSSPPVDEQLPAELDATPDAAPVGRRPQTNPAAELRMAREHSRRTLAEVSVGTRIPERHLRALERDAPLEQFPAPAYAKFFLREYAEYLRLDPDPLLREFEARHMPAEETPVAPLPAPHRTPRTRWGVIGVLSIAAIVLIALLPSLRSDEVAAPASPGTGASPAHDSGRDQVPAPTTREPHGVRAVLRLREASWVEAVVDGETVEASTLEPGTSVVYRARDLLRLKLGNAGGVRLRVNGELMETGGTGEVVALGFTWQDGQLSVTT